MIYELLSGLLIVCLVLGGILLVVVQIEATIKNGPARRKFRDDMREVNRKCAERKAREAGDQ